jgi:hypothetical protein
MWWIMQPQQLDGELNLPNNDVLLFLMDLAPLDRERQTSAATSEPGKLPDASDNLT